MAKCVENDNYLRFYQAHPAKIASFALLFKKFPRGGNSGKDPAPFRPSLARTIIWHERVHASTVEVKPIMFITFSREADVDGRKFSFFADLGIKK